MNNNKDKYISLHSLSEVAGKKLAGEIPDQTSIETLANLMQALSDPTRVRIIFLLTREELCVHDLTTLIGATQSSISHHLKTLRLNDLVESRRDGKTVYFPQSRRAGVNPGRRLTGLIVPRVPRSNALIQDLSVWFGKFHRFFSKGHQLFPRRDLPQLPLSCRRFSGPSC